MGGGEKRKFHYQKKTVVLTQNPYTNFANWFCQAVYAFYQQQIFCLVMHIAGDTSLDSAVKAWEKIHFFCMDQNENKRDLEHS